MFHNALYFYFFPPTHLISYKLNYMVTVSVHDPGLHGQSLTALASIGVGVVPTTLY